MFNSYKNIFWLIFFCDLLVLGIVGYIFLKPIRYRIFKVDHIETLVPNGKFERVLKNQWEGWRFRTKKVSLGIYCKESHGVDSLYHLYREKFRNRAKNVPLFRKGFITYKLESLKGRGYEEIMVVFIGPDSLLYWISTYSGSHLKRPHKVLLYCLENLKIRGTPLQPEALEEIKNYFKTLPVLRFLPDSFMGIVLIFVMLPLLIFFMVMTYGGTLPEKVKQGFGIVKFEEKCTYIKKTKMRNVIQPCAILLNENNILKIYIFRKLIKELSKDQITIEGSYIKIGPGESIRVKNIHEWMAFLS